jgi:hypothetical protein
MKFSIRDLLLVTVIVALTIGWWVEHRAVSRLAEEKARTEQEVKQLRDQLGRLTVADEKKLHAIAIAPDLARVEKRWRWRLHFPSDRPFRVCCAFSGLPQSGVPAGDQVLYDTKGEFTLNASAVKDQQGVWKLVLDCDTGPNITMPIQNATWLDDNLSVTISQTGKRGTESVDPGKPLVLLRLRRSKNVEVGGKVIGQTVEMNPTDGIMLWVEEMKPSAPVSNPPKP